MDLKKRKGKKIKNIVVFLIPWPKFCQCPQLFEEIFHTTKYNPCYKRKKPHTTLSPQNPAEVPSLGIQFYILYVLIIESEQ